MRPTQAISVLGACLATLCSAISAQSAINALQALLGVSLPNVTATGGVSLSGTIPGAWPNTITLLTLSGALKEAWGADEEKIVRTLVLIYSGCVEHMSCLGPLSTYAAVACILLLLLHAYALGV